MLQPKAQFLLKNRNILIDNSTGEVPPMASLLAKIELAKLGYVLDKPVTPAIWRDFSDIVEVLKEIRGDNDRWVPLHTGFPNNLPNPNEYFFKRLEDIIFEIASATDINTMEYLFDLKQFSADPIYQTRLQSLFDRVQLEQQIRKADFCSNTITLKVKTDAEAEADNSYGG